MPQTSPLTAAQVRELGDRFAFMLRSAGHDTTSAAVAEAMPKLLKELGIPLVGHTCTSTGRPLPYGKLAPAGKCARCDERRAEQAEGIPARPAPAWTNRVQTRREDTGGYPTNAEIDDHFRPGGPHATGACGPVCTFGDA